MHTSHTYWYSPRLEHDMGVAVFGHWGQPLLAFPTSPGDEWELQRHGLLDAVADFIDQGRVKVFCVGSNNHESFLNSSAHPFHRSWRQRMFDEYIRDEYVSDIHRIDILTTAVIVGTTNDDTGADGRSGTKHDPGAGGHSAADDDAGAGCD